MLLTVRQNAKVSFSCDTRSESRKWMGVCRFEIKGATKLYLIYFLGAVIILFSTGLCKSAFSILSFDTKVFFNSNFCWDLMLLTTSQITNILFSCDTRSKSRKWLGICRFQLKNILLFYFRLTVLWSFQ